MYERLPAPRASRGCLDPETLIAVDLACRHIDLPSESVSPQRQQVDDLRDLIRDALMAQTARLSDRITKRNGRGAGCSASVTAVETW